MQENGVLVRSSNGPVAKVPNHTRGKTGCLTCRRRKKRCNGPEATAARSKEQKHSDESRVKLRADQEVQRDSPVLTQKLGQKDHKDEESVRWTPRCEQCRRLNLRCLWEAERDIVAGTRSTPSSTSLALLKAPNSTQFGLKESDETANGWNRRLALRYYIQAFAAILSTNIENNGFLTVLIPMAMECSPLLDTIIACSSSHLALSRAELGLMALADRSSALTSFSSSFTKGNLAQEFSLAACLILTSMETIIGDTSAWYEHLGGAASIIKGTLAVGEDGHVVSQLQKSLEGRWLLRNFAYHDILASVTLDRQPLIPGQYWMSDNDTMVDTYFGLADFPMAMLAEISILDDSLRRSSSSNSTTQVFHGNYTSKNQQETLENFPEALRIENALLQWHPAEFQDQSLVCLASSYCSAALIHLYRTLRHHVQHSTMTLNEKIGREVKSIIEQVNKMPIGCLPECTVLFPLFLAGGETSVDSELRAIRERMQEMISYRQFENVRIALEVLEEVWDVRSRTLPIDPAKPYDWLHALERRGWKLALS